MTLAKRVALTVTVEPATAKKLGELSMKLDIPRGRIIDRLLRMGLNWQFDLIERVEEEVEV